jgi:hypothetical protein
LTIFTSYVQIWTPRFADNEHPKGSLWQGGS